MRKIRNKSGKMISCSNCNSRVKLQTIKEYHLDTIGIPNVWLINIEGYKCSTCGNKSIYLPNFGQLIDTVAEAIIFKNARYSSHEILFLRKYFKLTGKELAKKLGTSQKTVSFWLTGKANVSPAYGIKLRKLFNEEFRKHIDAKKEKHKRLAKKIMKIMEGLVIEEEVNYKDYIRHQAQLAVKEKLAEFESSDKVDLPMFKIPHSSGYVQIRMD